MRDALPTHFEVVIVGGGVAAGACVSTLRDGGYDGSILVACAEPHPPYTRPGLSKQVLRGEKPPAAALWRPEEWYGEQGVELLAGSAVTAIEPGPRAVRIAGRSVTFGSLLIATGAEPRRLPFAAELADRVHVLRSFADADEIRPHLGQGTRWLVIGGGFIGAEFAASAALTGSDVRLVMPQEVILESAFGPEVGGWFDDRLREHAVTIHNGTKVSSVLLRSDGLHVTLDDGEVLVVDHITVGAGVVANTGLAAQAGLDLALGGIATDSHLRTSAPGVYAAGDVAAYESDLHGRRVRIEHWDVAREHGVHVAREIMGTATGSFCTLPYFFGTMGDWAFLEYAGLGGGRTVFRGSPDGDTMSAAFLEADNVLTGLISVGRPDDLAAARELVLRRPRMQTDLLTDAGVPLQECTFAVPSVTG